MSDDLETRLKIAGEEPLPSTDELLEPLYERVPGRNEVELIVPPSLVPPVRTRVMREDVMWAYERNNGKPVKSSAVPRVPYPPGTIPNSIKTLVPFERPRGPLLIGIARFSAVQPQADVQLSHLRNLIARQDFLTQRATAEAQHPNLTIIPPAAKYFSIVLNGVRATTSCPLNPSFWTSTAQDDFIREVDIAHQAYLPHQHVYLLVRGVEGFTLARRWGNFGLRWPNLVIRIVFRRARVAEVDG